VTRFAAFLGPRDPVEALLREYLQTRAEWIALEFKRAGQGSDFGLRIAVAAFANTEGGDLFLGVDDTGSPVGSAVDPAEISRVLSQAGAPVRDGCITDLVRVVKDPRRIPLSNGLAVYWIDVIPQGLLAAVVRSDGTLGLYTRPGAESDEVRGFDAIDLFRKRTRARMLVALFLEFRRVVRAIPQYYIGPNQVRPDMLVPIRAIIESPEWLAVATDSDRSLTNNSYIGPLLALPSDAEAWERLPYQAKDQEWRMRTLMQLDQGGRALRRYIEAVGIALPSPDGRNW
jgi:Putative DNA-binding domain